VTSERKRAANRRNARASTGPKTAAGKAQVARNARRHGLTLAVAADPALARDVEELAQAICRNFSVGARGDKAPAVVAARLRFLARRVAEAQVDVRRVRRARHGLIAHALSDPRYLSPRGLRSRIALLGRAGDLLRRGVPVPLEMQDAILKRPQGAQKFALILTDPTRKLAALDRYERRARSRRKAAIRAFDAALVVREARSSDPVPPPASQKRAARPLPASQPERVAVREAERAPASCQNKACQNKATASGPCVSAKQSQRLSRRAESKSAVADFDILKCQSRASPTLVSPAPSDRRAGGTPALRSRAASAKQTQRSPASGSRRLDKTKPPPRDGTQHTAGLVASPLTRPAFASDPFHVRKRQGPCPGPPLRPVGDPAVTPEGTTRQFSGTGLIPAEAAVGRAPTARVPADWPRSSIRSAMAILQAAES